jgi:hypothetical protein
MKKILVILGILFSFIANGQNWNTITQGTRTTYTYFLGATRVDSGLVLGSVNNLTNIRFKDTLGTILRYNDSLYFRSTVGWINLSRKVDTTKYVKYTDTAAMLSKYLRKIDSTVYYPYASNPKGYLTAGTLDTTKLFRQGGNSFGANATLGTKDNKDLRFITNNVNNATLGADGTFYSPTYNWSLNTDHSFQLGSDAGFSPSGDLRVPHSRYMNFASNDGEVGSSGFGIRDSLGYVQYKDSLGSWHSFSSVGGNTIYTGDGVLNGDRVVDINGNGLDFINGSLGIGNFYFAPYTSSKKIVRTPTPALSNQYLPISVNGKYASNIGDIVDTTYKHYTDSSIIANTKGIDDVLAIGQVLTTDRLIDCNNNLLRFENVLRLTANGDNLGRSINGNGFDDNGAITLNYVDVTDTASMLSKYLRKVDTSTLSTRIDARVKYTDTSSMLSPYLRSNIAAGTYATIGNLALKVAIADTSNMLNPYLRKVDTASLSNRINTKGNGSVTNVATTNGLGISSSVATSTTTPNITIAVDTSNASILSRQRAATTYETITNVALKLNISDTAAMLTKYLRKSDTTTMLSPYLRSNVASGTYATTVALNGKLDTSGSYINEISSNSDALYNASSYSRAFHVGYLTQNLATQTSYKLFGTGSSSATPTFRTIDSNYFNNAFATQTRNTISLTTTGTSGAATYSSSTGVFNIPNYTVVSGANPTGTVGLSAVNGSASTFMRSDAAPALSQSIVPTWTGLHTFNPTTTASGAIARSLYVTSTLTAAANNDVLVTQDIAPTFTNGAFTGVANIGIRSSAWQLFTGSVGTAYGSSTYTSGSAPTNGFITYRSGSDAIFYHGSGGGFTFKFRGSTNNDANNRLTIMDAGVGIFMGASSPTAYLQIAGGASSANNAPMKFTSGTNLTTPENGAVEYDGSNWFMTSSSTRYTVDKSLRASAALDFPSTAASSSSDLTITVTGAADGDIVSFSTPNAAVNANSCFTAWVSAANTVTVRFNNYQTIGAINPASATFKVAVIK